MTRNLPAMVLRRLAALPLQVLGVSVVTFFVIRLLPGNPAEVLLGYERTEETVAALTKQLGLDKPILTQYWLYLERLLHGDLGHSYFTGEAVATDLIRRVPATLELISYSLLLALVVGLTLGIASAGRRRGVFVFINNIYGRAAGAFPDFWIGLIAVYVFFFLLRWAPAPLGRLSISGTPPPRVTGFYTIDSLIAGDLVTFADAASHLALPVLVLGLVTAPLIAKVTNSVLTDVLRTEYIRYGRACGLPRSTILTLRGSECASAGADGVRHAVRVPARRRGPDGKGLRLGRRRTLLGPGRQSVRLSRPARLRARRFGLHDDRLSHRRPGGHVARSADQDMSAAELEKDVPRELREEGPKTPGGVLSLQTMQRSLGRAGVLGLLPMLIWLVIAACAPLLTEYSPTRSLPEHALQSPNAIHWFGTNNTGADVFARVIYGARLDLFIGIISVGAAFLIAVPIGAAAGYSRSWWSGLIMRTMDFLQSFPIFVLAMTFVAVLGPRISNVIIILSLLNIPIFVRLTRSEVLVLREATFVEAARCVGNSNLRLILIHILPNALGPALAQVSINVGWALLLTAGLSFVGAGLQPPAPEWGLQISEGADNIISGQWWISLFPGLALGLCVLSFALAGDVARNLLDVRSR